MGPSELARRGPRRAIAVVGAGLAGLSAAWRLAQLGHRVSIFERHAAPGFVAHSVDVPARCLPAGAAPVRVDVPIRVFYAGYYPTLVRLYAELGVATEAVSYASSFHGDDGALYFRYRNWLAGGSSYSWVAPQDLLSARARRIVAGALRFRRRATQALAEGALGEVTLAEHLRHEGYDAAFVHGLLLPAIATICTCSHADALRFPARVIVDYLARGLTREPVRRAALGADEVARRLCAAIGARGGELHLGQPLVGLRREAAQVGTARGAAMAPVALRLADGRVQRFDHVVLATQANQALALLGESGESGGSHDEECRVLAGFSYRAVDVVMHTDVRLLPARRGDWSAVNLCVRPGQAQPQSTIWVNAVQPALAAVAGRSHAVPPLLQTVHPLQPPRDESVVSWAHFERPLVNAVSEQALAGLARLHCQPRRQVWFCGSYAQPGIPLLESAVRSAEVVVRAIEGAAVEGAAVEGAPVGWMAADATTA